VDFETAILKGNGTEVFSLIGSSFFRKENNVGFINRAKVSVEGVEVVEGGQEVFFDKIPVFFEKSRSKTIRARARVVFHRNNRSPELIQGEGAHQGGSLEGVERGRRDKGVKLKDIRRDPRHAKEVFVKAMKNLGFSVMRETRVTGVILENFNLIFPKAPGCAEVEVAGVLVAEDTVTDFCPLPPVGSIFSVLRT
jgi:hypothetical protein